MNNKSIPELDKLFLEVGTYRTSSDLKELYNFIKKFPRIAPYNAMLIHIQKPGSQYVATAYEWQQRFGRFILPGAGPLIILRPFGPVSFVFDLSDTYGKKPFPEELLNPFKAEGKIREEIFRRLIMNMKSEGILYSETDMGTGGAGSIQRSNIAREIGIYKKKKIIYIDVLYDMLVNKSHPIETKFATILHELGHLYCGHLGTPNEKWWKDRQGLNINEIEFEAESVCWLICERMGISNPSAKYLSGYLDNNASIPEISIETILTSVTAIENMINGTKEPRKENIKRIIEIEQASK